MSNEVILDQTDLGRPRVIAVDYDGTLYHNGDFNYKLINALIKFIENGNEVALWTCRSGEHLEEGKINRMICEGRKAVIRIERNGKTR